MFRAMSNRTEIISKLDKLLDNNDNLQERVKLQGEIVEILNKSAFKFTSPISTRDGKISFSNDLNMFVQNPKSFRKLFLIQYRLFPDFIID